MAFPLTDLPLKVRMAFGADLTADPLTWSFTDVSDRLVNSPINISRALAAGPSSAASACSLDLENTDGAMSPDNALSTLWPDVVQDVPIEVLAGDGDDERFSGYTSSYQPDFIPTTDGEPLSVVHITAAGILRRLQDSSETKPLGSPVRRTFGGTTPGDFVPHAYWPMEDGAEAHQFASATPGVQPMILGGGITLATSDQIVGSLPLPIWQAGSNAVGHVPAYTDTGSWTVQAAVIPPTDLLAQNQAVTVFNVQLSGGTYSSVSIGIAPGSQIGLVTRDLSGAVVDQWFDVFPTGTVYGETVTVTVQATDDASGTDDRWAANLIAADGSILASISELSGAGHYGRIVRVVANGTFALASNTVIGHVAVWTDPAFVMGTDDVTNGQAMGGWINETTVDRFNRILTESGVPHSVAGTSDTLMGVQPVDATLMDIINEIDAAEQGAVVEKGFGLRLICRSARYNLPVGLTVDLSTYRTAAGTASRVLAPTYDDQGYRNEWTVERLDGSFAVARAPAAEIRQRNVYDEAITVNLAEDRDLIQHASWRLNRDRLNRVSYSQTPIDIGENTVVDASFIDDWFALDLGAARIQRTNVPGLHGAGTIDQMLDAYTERLERRRLTITYTGAPYAPYLVAVYGVDPGGGVARYGAANTTLAAAVSASETSLLINPATDPWARTATHPSAFPFDINLGGVTYPVSAITPAVSDTFTRTATGWGSANTGQAYTTSGGVAGDYTTNGTKGLISISAVNSSRYATLSTGAPADVTLTSTVTLPVVATGASILVTTIGRFGSTANWYGAELVFNTTNVIQLRIVKNDGGAFSIIGGPYTLPTLHAAGRSWVTELSIVGSTLRARARRDVEAETVWLVAATDTSLTTGGGAGVRTALSAGNTNTLPVVPQFDNLSTTNPLTVSVTRLPDDKAHSAGDQVTVTDTGRYGL